MTPEHMEELGTLIARALTGDPVEVAADVATFRHRFRTLHYIN
jgi:hypothetical protein